MNNDIQNLIEYTFGNFRAVDVIDISLFSTIVFFFLRFMTAKSQRPVFIFLIALVFMTIISRFLDLYLMAHVVRLFFTAAVVVIAIVFQNDIRRFIEQLSGSLYARQDQQSWQKDIDGLIAVIMSLAEKRIGALLVFCGSESIDNFISGGERISAEVSEALLRSIFDPHTPGHDGAMVIQKGRITHFSCHLPLSKNVQQLKKLGTRHSAALGLSERCDALVVIISEERGKVSVARHGKLFYDIQSTQLKTQLEDFFTPTIIAPDKVKTLFIDTVKDKSGMKLLSLLFGLIAWIVVSYEPGTIIRSFSLPVEVRNLSNDLLIQKISTDEVKITLSGPSKVMNNLQMSNQKVTLDFQNVTNGMKIFQSTDFQLQLPRNVNIYKIYPPVVTANTTKVDRVDVPIQIKMIGDLSSNLKIKDIKLIPDKKKLLVPQSYQRSKINLFTQPVDLTKITPTNNRIVSSVIVPQNLQLDRESNGVVEVFFILEKYQEAMQNDE